MNAERRGRHPRERDGRPLPTGLVPPTGLDGARKPDSVTFPLVPGRHNLPIESKDVAFDRAPNDNIIRNADTAPNTDRTVFDVERWRTDADSLESDIKQQLDRAFKTRDDQIAWQDRAWRELNKLSVDLEAYNGPDKPELMERRADLREAYYWFVAQKDEEYEEPRREAEAHRERSGKNQTTQDRRGIAGDPRNTDTVRITGGDPAQHRSETGFQAIPGDWPDAAHHKAGNRTERKMKVLSRSLICRNCQRS
jgi:hypothetical protein